jgi:hypothetical protein
VVEVGELCRSQGSSSDGTGSKQADVRQVNGKDNRRQWEGRPWKKVCWRQPW